MNTIKDLNVKLAKTQQNMVNTLVEENPILDSIPVKPATHGIYNVYSKVTDIEGMDEVDYDDELPVVGISFALDQTRLGKIGGKLHMPQDAAMNMGGYDAYAADRFPSIVKKSGNDFEYRVYYKGFLAAALQNDKAVGCGGTTANKQYSLVAVTYNQDTTIGLYNPNAVNAGKLFDSKMLNGGNEYEIEYAGKKFIGKTLVSNMQFGLQIADPASVGALVNIEIAPDNSNPEKVTGLPKINQLDNLLTSVRAGRSTVLYAHPALVKAIASQYKLPRIQIANGSTDGLRYAAYDWQGIPFVASYNLAWGNEPVISL